MRVAHPHKEADAEPIDSTNVANALHAEEAQVAEPIPVQYMEMGGEHAGRPMADNLTISAEQGAHDVSRFRETLAESEQARLDAEIARTIDELRAGDAQPRQPPVQPTEAQTPQPEPQQQQRPASEDIEIQKLLEANPRLLSAVVELQNQAQNAQNYYAQESARAIEQAQRTYSDGLQQNAALLLGVIAQRNPELKASHPSQWPVILQSLNQTNPQRAQAILTELEGSRNFLTQVQQQETVRQQQFQTQYQAYQQETQRRWQNYSDDQDAKYEEFEKTRPAAEVKAVRENVLRVLSSIYGRPERDLIREYQTNPMARSSGTQIMAYKETAAQLAREGLAAKAVPAPVPTVQRPGSPASIAPQSDYDYRRLSDKLDRSTGRDALKAAAELVTARRNARR
jgi:hypothetical protein